jgi:hypothetical protein
MRRFFITILATLFVTSGGCQTMDHIKDRAVADYTHMTTGSDSDYIRSGGKSNY